MTATTASASRRPTVALFGLFGVTNIGNEASLTSALRFLERRHSAIDVVVVCARPEVVAEQHSVRALPISMSGRMPSFGRAPRAVRLLMRPALEVARWWSAYRFMKSVDAVVIPGTGILDDFGVAPHEMPYDLFRWSAAAWFARRRMSMLSVGAGPIDHPLSRWFMVSAVRFAGTVTYRDEISRSFMASLGVGSSPDTVRPDVAFGLSRPPQTRRADGDPVRVGLGVMAYYGWANDPNRGAETFRGYIESISAIADALLSGGCSVRLLVGESSDAIAVDQVVASLRHRGEAVSAEALIVERICDFDDLLSQIGACDVVAATRYHNVVAALMMSCPTVSIGYAEKNREVMACCGLEQYCHHVDDFEPLTVVRDVRQVTSLSDEIESRLVEVNDRLTADVHAQFDEVFVGVLHRASTLTSHRQPEEQDNP